MKRTSSITLYTTESDIDCHRTRMAVAIKGVPANLIQVDPLTPPEDLMELNPSLNLPLLVDRDLVLNESGIIIEYFDERFPHPPLLPVYPVQRAKFRLMIHRVVQDWYPLVKCIERDEDVEAKRLELREQITKVSSVFDEYPYFLSQDITMMDCTLAPVLWRLPELGVTFTGEAFESLRTYMERVFDTDAFQASLTERELEMRETIDEDEL